MADSKFSQGYRCEFIDSVPDHLYCKKCTLVARKLNITTCCGESYCHVCITDLKKEGKPCPSCGENDYNSFEQKRDQKQIASLQVYCNMKERGCDWSGLLEQLDTHLDPHQDNCQYVDTKCPLNCHMAIPKNKVEQHVAQHCTNRPYICQHCNFKATYEEVVEKHLAECKYVPLQCPNLCGVTFERDFLEDHMKMCRLQEVGCEFSGVGCEDRFVREDQEEHTRQNSQKHLTLTASLAVETKEQLQQKLLEQDKKHKEEVEKQLEEQNRKLVMKLQNQDQKHKEEEKVLKQQIMECKKKLEIQEQTTHQELKEQEQRIAELKKLFKQSIEKINMDHKEEKKKLNQVIKEQKKDIQELKQIHLLQEQKLKEEILKLSKEEQALKIELQQQREEHEAEKVNNMRKLKAQEMKLSEYQTLQHKTDQAVKKLESNSVQHEVKLQDYSQALGLNHSFTMNNFSVEKRKDKPGDWTSPAMYTHTYGYKFCIEVDANGYGRGRGRSLHVDFRCMSGEFDSQLKWPVEVEITLELLNQHGGQNPTSTIKMTWKKESKNLASFNRIEMEPDPQSQSKGFYKALLESINRHAFLKHSDIDAYLVNDTLHFNISKIKII